MSTARKISLGLTGVAMGVALLAPSAASGLEPIGLKPVPVGRTAPATPPTTPPPPTATATATPMPPVPTPALVKIRATAVRAAIERAVKAGKSECAGAVAAEHAYAACNGKCAQKAETAPITPAELAKCGSQSAEDCAAQLVASRAKDCVAAPAPAGCKDEYVKLQLENSECKSCKDLTASAAIGAAAVKAQAKAVAQAEEALAQARATLAAYEGMAGAQEAKTAKVCAAAKK